jgi:hypothetical protein
MARRIARVGDLFRPALAGRQGLDAALEAAAELLAATRRRRAKA